MTIKPDNWLSECMRKPCGIVTGITDLASAAALAPYDFLHAKTLVKAHDPALVRALEAAGFKEIGVLIDHAIPTGRTPIDPRVWLFMSRNGRSPSQVDKARMSRWHHDPNIPTAVADAILLRAVQELGDAETVVGMNYAGFMGVDNGRIRYIMSGVPGTGSKLLSAALTLLHWRGVDTLHAATYHWNDRALGLYRKFGAVETGRQTVWHWHRGEK